MLELMGYDTGVDQDAIHAIAAALPELVGHDLPSHPQGRSAPDPAPGPAFAAMTTA